MISSEVIYIAFELYMLSTLGFNQCVPMLAAVLVIYLLIHKCNKTMTIKLMCHFFYIQNYYKHGSTTCFSRFNFSY